MSSIKNAQAYLVQKVEVDVVWDNEESAMYQRSNPDPRVSAQWCLLQDASWLPIHGPEARELDEWYKSNYSVEVRTSGGYVTSNSTGRVFARL